MAEDIEKPDAAGFTADQQPIRLTVGKRVPAPAGVLPGAAARARGAENARYLTRTPKGIFFYRDHAEMVRDRERWIVAAMLARAQRG